MHVIVMVNIPMSSFCVICNLYVCTVKWVECFGAVFGRQRNTLEELSIITSNLFLTVIYLILLLSSV